MKVFNVLFITIIIFFLFSSLGICSSPAPGSPIVVVDLGGLTYEKIKELDLKNLQQTVANGASALMNTNTAGSRTVQNGFLTLGSGRITSYAGLDGEGYQSSENINAEKAQELYYRRTGKKAPEDGVVVLDLQRAKNKGKYDSWGAMGEAIRQAGLKKNILQRLTLEEQLN